MNRKLKITVLLILCITLMGTMMFFGANSIKAEATEREITASGTSGDVSWTFYSDGELCVYGEGAMADYSGYSSQPWASYRNKISSITVDEGVTAIGKSAFSVTAVKNISVASSVVSIGQAAFNECSYLENAVLSYGIENIGASAFTSCSKLKSITLPDSITEIGVYCFENCKSLEKVTVPNNLYRLKDRMFMGCSALKDVTFSSNTKYLSASAFSGCTSLENVYYGGSIANWCNIFFASETGNPLAYADNLYLNGQLVPSALVVPDTVTAIRQNAFYGASFLESVELPSGVTTIGNRAFSECGNLKNITLSESLKTIDWHAFENCGSLEKINIPESLTEINPHAFNGCSSLYAITVDDGNKKFSSDSVGVLFDKEKTKLIQYPIGIASKEYVIPDTVESINSYAFYGCKNIGKLTLPESVKCIGEYAFSGCTALTDISVTDSVECIHKNAFSGTGYLNDKANWDNGFLYLGTLLIGADKDKVAADCRLYSKTTLVAAEVFKGFKITSVYLPDNLKYINEYAFYNCDGLTGVDVPASVIVIGTEAFSGCGNIEEINLNEGLVEIQAKSFAYLPKLTGIQIPGTVDFIDPTAFYSSGVTDVYYGNSKAEWKRAVSGESLGDMTIHYTLISDDNTVIINHTDSNFDYEAGNVHLVVADLGNASSSYEQNGFYNRLLVDPIQVLDIKLVDGDGNDIQPLSDETITVKIKASDEFMNLMKSGLSAVSEYDIESENIDFSNDCFVFELNGEIISVAAEENFLKKFKVIHWYSDATEPTDHESFTHDEITVENGYIILETNHFSEYAVCTELEEAKNYTVKWIIDGVTTEQTVTEQTAITPPEVPQKAGYTFVGWTPEIPDTMPAQDMTFTAVYEKNTKIVTGISIISLPNKTNYTYKTDSLDLSGIVVKVTYSDGTSKLITETKAINTYGFSADTTGTKNVVVVYGGCTANFEVTVTYAWWQWLIRIFLLGFIWY